MSTQKRVAAIHDISGFGRCSLTVALPILSAAGIETSVIPTALLSTHTGGFTGFTYRDLTEDLLPFARHWKSLGLAFDALYSGFLGSFEQLNIVAEIFKLFKNEHNLVAVDPVMADNGKLYSIFTPDFAKGMAALCGQADLIIPNMTEAAFLLGKPYKEGPYTEAYIRGLLEGLAGLGPKNVVLTGVWFDDAKLGAASFQDGELHYAFSDKIEGMYHGTGDVFGSALIAAVLRGFTLGQSVQIAVDFTCACIRRTEKAGTDKRFGVHFEPELFGFMQRLMEKDRE